ncbi:MAG: protein serine/threonine phosphatase [Frankiales bacterium]|nr:protein serine/threonine phosphatase [Frankiales bacterium]
MTLAIRYAARSHAGLLRSLNEDSVYAGPRLLAVADGMGGHAAGEVASAVAIASIAPLDEDAPGADLLAALSGAAMTANTHLQQMAAADNQLAGMGTTLVALLFSGSRVGLAHVGDSRCYLLRDGELSQITHDHTLVQTLVDEGRISDEEASTHPQKSVLTRVLDGRPDVELDLSVREARVGDRFLVCSDGLTGPVASNDTLREALLIANPQESVDRLVALALKGGGPDNVTAIVADVVDADVPGAPPIVAGAAAESPQEAPPGIADSPASRARVAEGRDAAPRERAAQAPAPRRRGRTIAWTLAVLLVLGALATGIAVYVRSQYYVGFDHDNVAVFRGVQGSVAGIHFSNVEEKTTLARDQLSDLSAERVDDGIPARDLKDAQQIVARLIRQTQCATASPAPTSAPTSAPTGPPTARVVPSPSRTPAATTAPSPAVSPNPTISDCS